MSSPRPYTSDAWIQQVASDTVMDRAYRWLCERRKHYSANDSVWDLRWRWDTLKPQLQEQLLQGNLVFEPVHIIQVAGEQRTLWPASAALLLKALTLVLTERLAPHLSNRVYHVAGTGGTNAAVRYIAKHTPAATFVFRSDIKSYYASIDHALLMQQLIPLIPDPLVLDLIRKYLRHTVIDAGYYRTIEQGISLSCPLSPLLGALFLKPLDESMLALGLPYARYMDDWVLLSPSRWKLRRAIVVLNGVLTRLKLEKHPDKTFIGRIQRGFDFLGYWLSPRGIEMARQAIQRCIDKSTRLYEQEANVHRLGTYLQRWKQWAMTGVDVNKQAVDELVSRISYRCVFDASPLGRFNSR